MRGDEMSASTETTKTEEMSLTGIISNLARHYLGGRRGAMLLGATAVVAGVILNWSWFVAVGIAPLLLALAPCAAMCALGLCMSKMMDGKSCSTESKGAEGNSSSPGIPGKVQHEAVIPDQAAKNPEEKG